MQTYHLYDGLGSVTDLTDDEGDVLDGYTYDVFGALRSQSGSSANPWLFTGEQLDADSDLYYLRARYYDPAIGRFLSQDPLPTGNLYVYAGNNPVRYVDPSGLCIPGINCPPGLGGGTQPPSLARSKEGGAFDRGPLFRICTDSGCFLTRDHPSTIFHGGYICLFAPPGEPRDCMPIPSRSGGSGCDEAEAITGGLISVLGAIAIGAPAAIALVTPGLQPGAIILLEGPGVIVEGAAITLIIDSGCVD